MPILCATDFSPRAEAAIDLAAALAKRAGNTPLVLLHVVEPLHAAPPGPPSLALGWELAMKESTSVELATLAARLRERGLTVSTRVRLGDPAVEILDEARHLAPELIVVGTNGRSRVAAAFLGTTASRVVRRSACPVLVVPRDKIDVSRWTSGQPLRLVVGADGTRAAAAALGWLGAAGPSLAPEAIILRLYWPPQEALRYGLPPLDPGGEEPPELVRRMERDLRRQLAASPALANSRLRFRSAHVDAADVLDQEGELLGADALVVGIPGKAPPSWDALVPARVLRATRLPLFCVPESSLPLPHSIPEVRAVLVATDLSALSNQAILPAYSLLQAAGGRVELCHVRTAGEPGDAAEDEAQLARLVPEDAAARGIVTNLVVLNEADPASALLAAITRLNVDVVALASHGRSGLSRALAGSVAEQVARRSPRPVLLVHPHPRS